MGIEIGKAQEILAEHLCAAFSELPKEEKTLKTAADILTERIGLRLADIAQEMADDISVSTPEIRKAMRKLKPESFTALYDLANEDKADEALVLIENAVNENTNQQVLDTQGKFSFNGSAVEMFDDEMFVAYLITFDAETCIDSEERYAAVRVVQRFESKMGDDPARRPIGYYGHSYGVIEVLDFRYFSYLVNNYLEKHALPEDYTGMKVLFDDALEEANGEFLKSQGTPKPAQP